MKGHTTMIDVYNPPSSVVAGYALAVALLVFAGIALWRRRSRAVRRGANSYATAAVFFTVTAVLVALTTVTLHVVQYEFSAWSVSLSGASSPEPKTDPLTIMVAGVLVLVSIFALVNTISRNKAVQTAVAVTALGVTWTLFADAWHYRTYTDGWSLATSGGWALTVAGVIAFLAAIATVGVRKYGEHKFEQGRLAALREQSEREQQQLDIEAAPIPRTH